MNVSGPRSPLAAAYGLAPVARPAAPKPAVAATPAAPAEAAAAPAAPAAMPKGADPKLWSVLTTEEKTWFAKQAELGPLTYGPAAQMRTAAPAAAAPRGLRLDVSA